MSTVELPGGYVVAEGESTVHNGLSRLGGTFKPRAYQLEMLEQSMRRNIIVAVQAPLVSSSSAANTT